MTSGAFYLSETEAGAVRPLNPPPGMPTKIKVRVGDEIKEFPVSYWEKDVIEEGNFIYQKDGRKLPVSLNRIDHWVDNIRKMRDAGIELHTPLSHSDRPGENMGFIIGARREGSRLKLTKQVIGEDGALVAARNRASVCIEPEFKDEKGRVWNDVIIHSAFTPVPVISGQGAFVPMTLSREGHDAVPVYYHSAADRSTVMPKLNDEQRERLKKVLPKDAAIPDEPDNEAFIKFVEGRAQEAVAVLSRATKAETDLATARSEVEGLKLSRSRETQMDPERLYDRRRFVSTALDGLGDRGYSKATVDALRTYLVGDEKSPNVMMLSRENPDNFTSPIRAEKLIEILAGNVPVPPKGIQSGMQMARQTQGDPAADEKKYDADYDAARASRNAQLEAQGIKP